MIRGLAFKDRLLCGDQGIFPLSTLGLASNYGYTRYLAKYMYIHVHTCIEGGHLRYAAALQIKCATEGVRGETVQLQQARAAMSSNGLEQQCGRRPEDRKGVRPACAR